LCIICGIRTFTELIDRFVDTALFRRPIGKDFDRQCAITRAEIGEDAKVTYIIKCGTVRHLGVGLSLVVTNIYISISV
jgi:hypothetical protein